VYNNIAVRNVYSVQEAAEKLGLDTSQVRRLLAKGEVKGKKLGRDWAVFSLDYKRKRKPKRKKEVENDESSNQ
jgi:excisionase family DNA binding protein